MFLFRRIPVAFREDLVIHNELYFALETLGHGNVEAHIVSNTGCLWMEIKGLEVKRVLVTLPVDAEITPAVLSSDIAAERQAAIAKAVASSPNQMLVRTDQPLAAAIEEVERAMLKGALANSPDLETAAEKLDITRKGLFLKRQRLGLE